MNKELKEELFFYIAERVGILAIGIIVGFFIGFLLFNGVAP